MNCGGYLEVVSGVDMLIAGQLGQEETALLC